MTGTIYDNGVEIVNQPEDADIPTDLTPTACNSFSIRGDGAGNIGIDFKNRADGCRSTVARITINREHARLLKEALELGLSYETAQCCIVNGQKLYMKG